MTETKKGLRNAIIALKANGLSSDEILECILSALEGASTKEEPKVEQNVTEENLSVELSQLLRKMGFRANLKGYAYVRYAILYCMKNNNPSITKELYPQVAKEFGTTSTRVERAIRHAIETAWCVGNPEVYEEYFGNTIEEGKKPTNSEFVAMLVDHLTLKDI